MRHIDDITNDFSLNQAVISGHLKPEEAEAYRTRQRVTIDSTLER